MDDRFRIKIAMIEVRILLRFNKILPFLLNPFDHSAETFFPRMNRGIERILFGCDGTDIFSIVLAERIMGSVEIDQHLSSRHRFDIKIPSLRISLSP